LCLQKKKRRGLRWMRGWEETEEEEEEEGEGEA
jgi:hypothetical protein